MKNLTLENVSGFTVFWIIYLYGFLILVTSVVILDGWQSLNGILFGQEKKSYIR